MKSLYNALFAVTITAITTGLCVLLLVFIGSAIQQQRQMIAAQAMHRTGCTGQAASLASEIQSLGAVSVHCE